MMEKEAKKEAFRKYLESSGVVDALTKVLVALYEQNNKPSSAIEFVQQKLGGPSLSEYEKLKAEMAELQAKYNDLQATHEETCRLVSFVLKHNAISLTVCVTIVQTFKRVAMSIYSCSFSSQALRLFANADSKWKATELNTITSHSIYSIHIIWSVIELSSTDWHLYDVGL